ncbi:phosphatase PAP2 family protein [Glacieibacterium sp.]|uniref:phosphatase PAP2 family protein n=1 Tax=Glacieibacterium sp. TaxID=2860237 RepID=UPI003AFF9CD2
MTTPSDPEQADIAVANAVEPLQDTAPVKALGWASEIADQPQLISSCIAVGVAGLVLGSRRLARTGGRMLAAELLVTKLKSLIKHRIDRSRPAELAKGHGYTAEAGNDTSSEMSSFPSGHTGGAVAVARAFARDYPEQAVVGYGVAAAIAVIQVPRGKHYVSDLIAGALLGVAAEQASWAVERLVVGSRGSN